MVIGVTVLVISFDPTYYDGDASKLILLETTKKPIYLLKLK
jgi:hypothetical protein